MQDRYAGDIGDYFKLAILRAVAQADDKLGVAWWLYPDESHNGDGRHIKYLSQPASWRHIDPPLFDALARMVSSGARSVAALEALALLPAASYHREPPHFGGTPIERRFARHAWARDVVDWANDRTILFLDPDNGLEPSRFSAGTAKAGKSVTLAEVALLADGNRPLIVYHHQTRRPGGHLAEIDYWSEQLRRSGAGRVDCVRVAPFSARAFFLLNGTVDMRQRLTDAVERWAVPKITWHPQD